MSESTVFLNEKIIDNKIKCVLNGGATFSSDVPTGFNFGSTLPTYMRRCDTTATQTIYLRVTNSNFTQVGVVPAEVKLNDDSTIRVTTGAMPSNVTSPRVVFFDNMNFEFNYTDM